MEIVTCSAPINIAIIKYWGKICAKYNIPLNDSLSITLHQDDLRAETSVATCTTFKEDRVWLNGVEVDVKSNIRLVACFSEIRRHARVQAIARGESIHEISKYDQKVHVCSKNNFPTAAGLASSAAGYAALVTSLGRLFNISGDISAIARRGSGSACRSMYGGWVEWVKGGDIDIGSDSVAKQFLPEDHWPELCVFILVTSGRRKSTGSTQGMQRSVETSSLLRYRATEIVPKRIADVKKAISTRNFHTFSEICMKESNQLHAICRDSFPPLEYLNGVSHDIIRFVQAYNGKFEKNRIAYTFDAGPNAFLFTLDKFKDTVAQLLHFYFGPKTDHINGFKFIRGFDLSENITDENLNFDFQPCRGSVEYVILTKPGPGPQQFYDVHLISEKTGLPI